MDEWVDNLLRDDEHSWVPKTMGDPVDPDSVRSADGCDSILQHVQPGPFPLECELPRFFHGNIIACVGDPEVMLYKAGSEFPRHVDRRRHISTSPELLHVGTMLFVRYSKDAVGGHLRVATRVAKDYAVELTTPNTGPDWKVAMICRGDAHWVTKLDKGERVVVKVSVHIRNTRYGTPMGIRGKAADMYRADLAYDRRTMSEGMPIKDALELWHTEYTAARTKSERAPTRFD
jgi:hypothetical protein